MTTPKERLKTLSARLDQHLQADPNHPRAARMQNDSAAVKRYLDEREINERKTE